MTKKLEVNKGTLYTTLLDMGGEGSYIKTYRNADGLYVTDFVFTNQLSGKVLTIRGVTNNVYSLYKPVYLAMMNFCKINAQYDIDIEIDDLLEKPIDQSQEEEIVL